MAESHTTELATLPMAREALPRELVRDILFKRAIVGVFHQISPKHMGRYLRETEWRWNNRGPFQTRLATLFGTKAGPLPLKALLA